MFHIIVGGFFYIPISEISNIILFQFSNNLTEFYDFYKKHNHIVSLYIKLFDT